MIETTFEVGGDDGSVISAPIRLDLWIDLVCAWCWVGKRRLEAALAAFAPGAVEVRWRAFQLRPEFPPEGVDPETYFKHRFGSVEVAHERNARMTEIAADDGLALRYDLMRRLPSTLLAHRAIKLSADPGAAVEALFAAYLGRGEDIGDLDTLLRAMPEADRDALAAGAGAERAAEDRRAALAIGLSGVPFFVAHGERALALSGAREPAELAALLRSCAREPGARVS